MKKEIIIVFVAAMCFAAPQFVLAQTGSPTPTRIPTSTPNPSSAPTNTPQPSSTPTTTPSPTAKPSPTPNPQPSPVIITLPNTSDEDKPSSTEKKPTPQPTPVLVPLHTDSSPKSKNIYSETEVTPTKEPEQTKISNETAPVKEIGDAIQKNFYASEKFSPFMTKSLFIFSVFLVVAGVLLINFERISYGLHRLFNSRRVDNEIIIHRFG